MRISDWSSDVCSSDLHHADVRDLIVASRTADETASKPDPLMLRELLALEGLRAEQALMIGDTEYDVAMAAAIDMPAIGVICGVHAPQRLKQAGACSLLERVADQIGRAAGRERVCQYV